MSVTFSLVGTRGDTTGAASVTTGSGTTTASGSDFVILVINDPSADGAADVSGVQDTNSNGSNTWVQKGGTQQTPANGLAIQVFVALNGTGGTGHTATANFVNSGGFGSVYLLEIKGTNHVVDVATGNAFVSPGVTNAYALASGALAQSTEGVLAFCGVDSGLTGTWSVSGGSSSLLTNEPGGTNYPSAIATALPGTTASQTYTFTYADGTTGHQYAEIILSFEQASAGAPVQDYGEDAELYFCGDDDMAAELWIEEASLSAPVSTPQVLPSYETDDETHLWWEDYDEPLIEDGQWSGPIQPNAPPYQVEDQFPHFDFDVGDDYEWFISDSAPVGIAQPSSPVEDPQGADSDDAGDDWDTLADYASPVGGNAAVVQSLAIEDAWAHEDDPSDEWNADDSSSVGANQPSPPIEDAWDHWPDDYEDELIVLDDASFENLWYDDPWEWTEDVHEDDLTDDGSNVRNGNAVVAAPLTPEDAWLHEDDSSDEWNADDSIPVGPNQPPRGPDDAWDWIDDEPPYLLVGSYQQTDNLCPVEDAWSWDDHEGDDWDIGDSAPVGANGIGQTPLGPDDAWSHEDDHTDEPFGDDSAPVGLAQPAPPVEDGWDWSPEDHDEWSADDSAAVGPDFVPPQAQPAEDAWSHEDDHTDEWEWSVADATQVGQAQPPLPPEDAQGADHDDVGDDWETWANSDSGVPIPNFVAPPAQCPEDPWSHEDDHTDDWILDELAPVGANQPPQPVEDSQGADHDDAGDDWEAWAAADSAPVGPNLPLNFTLCLEDAWSHEDDHTDLWENYAYDAIGAAAVPPAPPQPPPIPLTAFCCGADYDICIDQNATYTRIITWLLVTGASKLPVNLTSCTASMQIRQYPLSTTVLYDASADITLGGAAGTITLSIPSAATENFTWWSGVYDLLITDTYGNVTRLLSGKVTVCQGVTVPGHGIQIVTDSGVWLATDSGILLYTS